MSEGGDPACWLDLVCPNCGQLNEAWADGTPCQRCGTLHEVDGADQGGSRD